MSIARIQMYHLITAFEQDVRNILDRFVVSELGEEAVLSEFLEEAQLRMSADINSQTQLIDYLDLRPTYDLLNRHRELLPSGLASELRDLTPSLDQIVPIRHRVMHSRPFREQDPDQLLSSLRMFSQPQWRLLRDALKLYDDDPLWALEDDLPRATDDRVKNNLPLPEYDDTGLVGRDKEISQLLADLKRRRESVLTVTGEGGIGKSALALEVASRLLDDSESPFELILWVSLKTERLTGSGVELITDSVDSLVGATRLLGEAIAPGFEGHVDELARALDGIPTLICFDNLETITGDEFVTLYERLPAEVSYLITSRQGIGQLERRVSLGALDNASATSLLNQLIRIRSIEPLARISGDARKEIARRLRNSPLSIRWYINAIEAGGSPQALLENQQELLAYCVGSVLKSLSEAASTVLAALHIANDAVDESQLVLLTELRVDGVRSALQELVRGSLVRYTFSSDLVTTIELTEAAQRFLESQVVQDDPERLRILDNLNQARLSAEKRRAMERSQRLAPWATRVRSPEDEPVATILHRALRASSARNIDNAYELIEEAKRLSPEYWEIYRVDAFISASHGNSVRATSRYQQAYELAGEAEHKAVVAHFFSGHLARHEGNMAEAIRLAREAHSVIETQETLRALGERLLWNGDFDEALEHLREVAAVDTGRERLLAVTSLVGALHRVAEHNLRERRNFLDAWNAGIEGWYLGVGLIDEGVFDERLKRVTIECAVWAMKATKVANLAGQTPPELDAALSSMSSHLGLLLKSRRVAKYLFRELLDLRDELPRIRELLDSAAARADVRYYSTTSAAFQLSTWGSTEQHRSLKGWHRGRITGLPCGAYGFIEPSDGGPDVYFNESALPLSESIEDMRRDDPVLYLTPPDTAVDRAQAGAVIKLDQRVGSRESESTIRAKEAQVIFVSSKGFLFASDPNHPDVRIFVHVTSFDVVDDFSSCQVGSSIELLWRIDSDDPAKGTAIVASASGGLEDLEGK